MERLSFLACSLALASSTLAAGPSIPPPTGCLEDFAECKENCTIEFGTSLSTREKLGKCLDRCLGNRDDCRERYYQEHRAATPPREPDEETRSQDAVPGGTSNTQRSTADEGPPGRTRYAEPAEEDVKKEADPPASARTRQGDPPEKPGKSLPPARSATDPQSEEKDRAEAARREAAREDAEREAGERRAAERKKEPEKKRPLDEWDPDAL